MQLKMFVVNTSNHEKYKQVAKILWEYFHPMTSQTEIDCHPYQILLKAELKSRTLAKDGLRITLLDTISDAKLLSSEAKMTLNSKLARSNLPSLTELIAVVDNVPFKVLARGKIRSLDEYYIIKEIIESFEMQIAEKDRLELSKILSEFENK